MTAQTIEAAIGEALLAHVRDFEYPDMSPALEVAWPNVVFDPVEGVPYLRVDILTSTPSRLTVSHKDTNLYAGLLQITAVVPLGVGASIPLEILGAVLKYFREGTKLPHPFGVVVIGRADGGLGRPYQGAPVRDQNWWNSPAIIPWYSLVAQGA